MEKPSGERLSKTVLPNTIRTVTSPDPMKVATAPVRVAKAASASELRPVEASSRPAAAHSRQLPRASLLGLEPKMERTISLQLADILEQIPAGYVKSPETLDLSRRVVLDALEIEKGMGESKPSVSLASIYKEAPEIFAHRLAPTESACVLLPYEKVLEEFRSLRVRPDQEHDDMAPQLDTPFLKVTIEDTKRFGTTMEPLQTSSLPPVRVEPASAETIAAATPEPIASATIKRRSPPLLSPGVSLHDPISKKQETPRPKAPGPAGPKKISFRLPPNGTGAPASERVPASSGPPVPTSLPEPPRAGEDPFTKVTAPCEDLRSKFQRGSPARPAREVAAAVSPPKRDETKIALALNRLLQEVPAFQLNGSPSAVPENVRVELPLSLIQPQLASGRVVISPTVLQRAMPEIYRPLLNVDPGETPISLPLEEILKNLPTTTLRLRDDQEVTVIAETFETTFSIKADEDARRLHTGAGLAPKASEKPAEQPQIQEKAETAREDLPALAPAKEEKPEAKSVVALASAFPGGRHAAVAEPSQAAISIKAGEEAERFQTHPEPVPTSLPAPPRAGETRFTNVTAPCEDLRPRLQRGSPARPAREVAAALSPPKRDETKIALALNRLLQEVPAFQLNGSPAAIPENVRVELPLSSIQPQLAGGRVVISPTVLQRAMPEIYRPLLNIDPGETPISLPLEEILKNLPATTLRLRDDQEETVIAETFETAFSIKADEDARRLHAGAGLTPKVFEKPAEQPQIQEKAETAREDLPALAPAKEEKPEAKSVVARATALPAAREPAAAEPSRAAISIKAGEEAERFQTRAEPVSKVSEKPAEHAQVPKKNEMERKEPSGAVLAREEKHDAKSVLGRVCALPGVAACAIAFADDGLTLAGSLPAELAADGLCAMAPSLLQKIDNHMRGTKLGLFTAMTLHCAQWPLTFFMHGNICLTALHAGGELTSETRAELTRITQELSRTYSQPEPSSHVDH
jgi:hypothetical protein